MFRIINRVLMKILCVSTLSLLLVLAPSCYPVFKHPIPAPEKLKPDSKILGVWFRTVATGGEQVSVFPRDNGWIDVVYIYGIKSKFYRDGINLLVFEGYSTSVKEHKFLCLRPRKKDLLAMGKKGDKIDEANFFIVNYDLSRKGNLIVKHFPTEKIGNLINSGELSGRVSKKDLDEGRLTDEVLVTASSEELVTVISEKGIGAFVEETVQGMMVFSRKQEQ